MTIKPFHTYTDDKLTPSEPVDIPVTDLPYANPQDVPLPVREMIKRAHDSGLKIKQLTQIYSLPSEWIMIFVAPNKGSA